MPKPRKEIQSETLEKLINSGQKKFVRYDEGAVLYLQSLLNLEIRQLIIR